MSACVFSLHDIGRDNNFLKWRAFIFLCSVTMVKVLDASGPPGLPTLLPAATSGTMLTTAISALSFSPDGEVPTYCVD